MSAFLDAVSGAGYGLTDYDIDGMLDDFGIGGAGVDTAIQNATNAGDSSYLSDLESYGSDPNFQMNTGSDRRFSQGTASAGGSYDDSSVPSGNGLLSQVLGMMRSNPLAASALLRGISGIASGYNSRELAGLTQENALALLAQKFNNDKEMLGLTHGNALEILGLNQEYGRDMLARQHTNAKDLLEQQQANAIAQKQWDEDSRLRTRQRISDSITGMGDMSSGSVGPLTRQSGNSVFDENGRIR